MICPIEKSNTQCRVCGNRNGNQNYIAKEMMFGSQSRFTYFQCSVCGCIQIAKTPTDIAKYYPLNYYSFSKTPTKSTVSRLKSLIEQILRQKRLSYAIFRRGVFGKLCFILFPGYADSSLSILNMKEDSRILDVGCGSGVLLYTLMEIGFKNLLGIDLFIEKDVSYPNGLRIEKKPLEELTGDWDLIMFNHSLEHMPNQQIALELVSSLLSPSGVCVINMPTVSSYAWRTYGTNWVQLDAPRHTLLHSITSLRMLAEKTHLQLRSVFYNSTAFQFWGSKRYIRGLPLNSTGHHTENPILGVFSILQTLRFSKKVRYFNLTGQGDQAAFYLRKK